jgi:hypothetical protein
VSVVRTISLSLFSLWLMAAAAAAQTSSVAPAKPAPHASGQATIYILRPNSVGTAIWGRLSSPTIKIDGVTVGELVGGTYIVASRPAGHHTLVVDTALAANWESPVDLAGGQILYVEIGPYSDAIGQQLANSLVSNTWGERMPGHSWNPGFCFYSLDAAHGRAALNGLTNVTRR